MQTHDKPTVGQAADAGLGFGLTCRVCGDRRTLWARDLLKARPTWSQVYALELQSLVRCKACGAWAYDAVMVHPESAKAAGGYPGVSG
jgi:hypothetical protein